MECERRDWVVLNVPHRPELRSRQRRTAAQRSALKDVAFLLRVSSMTSLQAPVRTWRARRRSSGRVGKAASPAYLHS